jgi:hypothetical protein
MDRLRLPEDRTEVEIERTNIHNRLVRELCMHEIRLGKITGDHYAAVCSTWKARRMIDELYPDA